MGSKGTNSSASGRIGGELMYRGTNSGADAFSSQTPLHAVVPSEDGSLGARSRPLQSSSCGGGSPGGAAIAHSTGEGPGASRGVVFADTHWRGRWDTASPSGGASCPEVWWPGGPAASGGGSRGIRMPKSSRNSGSRSSCPSQDLRFAEVHNFLMLASRPCTSEHATCRIPSPAKVFRRSLTGASWNVVTKSRVASFVRTLTNAWPRFSPVALSIGRERKAMG
mmetsp:Transcript_107524/g.300405  ORF Transcript_107524/g.300405 Transcript_107524/m.300405 type:complete len:223 (+) Transcript_107524:184-852(+)